MQSLCISTKQLIPGSRLHRCRCTAPAVCCWRWGGFWSCLQRLSWAGSSASPAGLWARRYSRSGPGWWCCPSHSTPQIQSLRRHSRPHTLQPGKGGNQSQWGRDTVAILYDTVILCLLNMLLWQTVDCKLCVTYQKLQQSVSPIHTVDNFIHVLHWSFTKLLHHEENIDEESTKNLRVTEESVLYKQKQKKDESVYEQYLSVSCSVLVRYLQWGEDWWGDDDEKPEVHVKELTDHIRHVGWKDQQEETQRHCSEVLPQTPTRRQQSVQKKKSIRFNIRTGIQPGYISCYLTQSLSF